MRVVSAITVTIGVLLLAAPMVQVVNTQSSNPVVSGVSGNLAHGATVTISGSGFGTKATAPPVKYDDFQTVPVGSRIATSAAAGPPWIETTNQNYDPIAATSKLRSGTPFNRNMQSHWRDGDPSGGSNVAVVGQNFVKGMIDAWTYIDTTAITSFTFSNNKLFRIHTTGAGAPNADMATANGCGSDLTNWVAAQRDGINRPSNDPGDWFNSGAGVRMCNTWVHVQWLINAGSGNGAANGAIIAYVNGYPHYNHSNLVTTGPGHTSWQEWFVGNYVNNNNGPWGGHLYQYWESVYIDNSWSRVEVGDNANYANSVHREIQVPTAWSNSQITVRLNRGSFPDLSNVYLYVVDANNNASPGIRLTGGTNQLTAPTNLRIAP